MVNIGTPATADNCGVLSVTNYHASTTYPVGTTRVTWTVTDIHNNTNTCAQTVVVTDNEAPMAYQLTFLTIVAINLVAAK